MKTRNVLAGVVLAAALSGGVAATALAQSGPSPSPTTPPPTTSTASSSSDSGAAAVAAGTKTPRKDFACAHRTEIDNLLSQRKSLLASRLTLLQQARQSAVNAHADKWVVKIDNHIAQTAKAQTKVTSRTERFTDWAAKNCTS
jgi:hypothetical protein